MKTVNANPDQPFNPSEQEAWRQFEASDRNGQALFGPMVDPKATPPEYVACFEGIGRFAVRLMPGTYWQRNGRWMLEDADGTAAPVPDPLKEAWRSAIAVHDRLVRELEIGAYVVPVAIFPDMEPDADIMREAEPTSVKVLWGPDDQVRKLVDLLGEKEMRTAFNGSYIEREVRVLQRPPSVEASVPAEPVSEAAPEDAAPENGPPEVGGRIGALVIQRAETVNINLTIVYGGTGDEPPILTVQGR